MPRNVHALMQYTNDLDAAALAGAIEQDMGSDAVTEVTGTDGVRAVAFDAAGSERGTG